MNARLAAALLLAASTTLALAPGGADDGALRAPDGGPIDAGLVDAGPADAGGDGGAATARDIEPDPAPVLDAVDAGEPFVDGGPEPDGGDELIDAGEAPELGPAPEPAGATYARFLVGAGAMGAAVGLTVAGITGGLAANDWAAAQNPSRDPAQAQDQQSRAALLGAVAGAAAVMATASGGLAVAGAIWGLVGAE